MPIPPRRPACLPAVTTAVLAFVTLAAGRGDAQAVIKVNEDVSFKLGVLLQAQGDWLESAVADDTQQNLFLRRARFLVGGTLAKDVSFFFAADASNIGKAIGGAKNGASLNVQDAFVSWKLADELILDGGFMRAAAVRNALQGATTLLPMDYGPSTFSWSAPAQNVVVGQDTGLQARGNPFGRHLEYRVGVWTGQRDAAGKQSFRTTARLQYSLLDAEPGFYLSGTHLGKKKIVTFGIGCDAQKDYEQWAADAFVDHPLGPGSLTVQVDYMRLDGGTTFPTLPRQNVIYLEGGYLLSASRLMPFLTYGGKDVSAGSAGDETRWSVGLGYFAAGHSFNVKAAYGRIEPKGAKSLQQVTIQLQGFYF